MIRSSLAALTFVVLSPLCVAGCSADRAALREQGVVFYLDGAGGGGLLGGWGNGVRDGLKQAGYAGDFVDVPWHTGLGVAADQSAEVAYKRGKAQGVAREIVAYRKRYPQREVALVGLSAGTAVAAFTLEALPEDQAVDDVVLLGSSLSAHHDMSVALRHVRRKLYIFTSDKDAVLSVLVPLAGTADREFCGACSAGLGGFHLPRSASAETRRLYGKIENIAWRSEFERAGNFGGHTDATGGAFVRQYVAPLILRDAPRFTAAGRQPASE